MQTRSTRFETTVNRAGLSWWRSLFAIMLAGVLSLAMVACEAEVEEEPGLGIDDEIGGVEPGLEEPGEVEMDMGATVDDITSNPAAYFGNQVTVSGEVDEIYGGNAFTIVDDVLGGELAVILTGPPADAPLADMMVQVTGTVRQFVVAEIETEYGLDLDPQFETDIEETRPVLVATQMTKMDVPVGGVE